MKKTLLILTTLITAYLLLLSGCPSPSEDPPKPLSIKANVEKEEFLKDFEIPEDQKITFTRNPANAQGSFRVIPGLPDGLKLNVETSTIEGTPTKLSTAADYTVTFTGAGKFENPTATAIINIAVKELSITPSVNEISFAENVKIAEEHRITFKRFPADAQGSFTVEPRLPAGLQLDPNTGTIEGTPTALINAANYTVNFTASAPYTGRSATATVNIAVVDLAITASISNAVLAQNGNFSGEKGISFQKFPANATGQFSISPDLPTGLSLDTASGLISGNPTEVAVKDEYTITLTGSEEYTGKTTSTTLTLTVAPFTITPNRNPAIFLKDREIPEANRISFTASPPGLTGVYTITPDLPDGLSIDKNTGMIGGTASRGAEKGEYKITFTGSGIYRGTAEASVNIAVASLTPSPSQIQAEINKAITPITITKVPTDMTGNFTVSPDLPVGLTIDRVTGSLSGTPTDNGKPTDYTITFTGSGEYSEAILTAMVNIWVYKSYAPATKAELKKAIDAEIALQGDRADLNYIDTSAITDMSFLLHQYSSFNGDISGWDVGNVTDMSSIFLDASSFNGDISGWDVSNVTSMYEMFKNTSAFNGDISGWNVSKVTNMRFMFRGADTFNGDISNWDVGNVTDMESMFFSATSFNRNISKWNVSKVTGMEQMFFNATSFNKDISEWDVGNVTDMTSIFSGASSFNGDISGWDVSNVTSMSFMFSAANAFNGDISKWNVSNAIGMIAMFRNAVAFNGDISGWNVGKVTRMQQMFFGANAFNQNISGWNVNKVTSYANFRTGSALTDTNTPKKFKDDGE